MILFIAAISPMNLQNPVKLCALYRGQNAINSENLAGVFRNIETSMIEMPNNSADPPSQFLAYLAGVPHDAVVLSVYQASSDEYKVMDEYVSADFAQTFMKVDKRTKAKFAKYCKGVFKELGAVYFKGMVRIASYLIAYHHALDVLNCFNKFFRCKKTKHLIVQFVRDVHDKIFSKLDAKIPASYSFSGKIVITPEATMYDVYLQKTLKELRESKGIGEADLDMDNIRNLIYALFLHGRQSNWIGVMKRILAYGTPDILFIVLFFFTNRTENTVAYDLRDKQAIMSSIEYCSMADINIDNFMSDKTIAPPRNS